MDINLSKFQDMVRDREAWHAAIHGVTKSRTQLINWPFVGISQGPPKTEFLPQASPSRTQQHPLLSRLHLALPGNLPDWHLSQPSRATSGQKETYFFAAFTLGSGNHPIYSNFFSLLSQWSKAAMVSYLLMTHTSIYQDTLSNSLVVLWRLSLWAWDQRKMSHLSK